MPTFNQLATNISKRDLNSAIQNAHTWIQYLCKNIPGRYLKLKIPIEFGDTEIYMIDYVSSYDENGRKIFPLPDFGIEMLIKIMEQLPEPKM